MRYKILKDTDNLELGRLITNHLNKGWKLYGLPMATKIEVQETDLRKDTWDRVEYAQAIIADKES